MTKADKHKVLDLLEAGLSPNEVANILGCASGYVRATKQRATPAGRKRYAKWERERKRRLRADPVFCEAEKARHRAYYRRQKAEREATDA